MVYELRAECPKTCINLNGAPDCGLKKPIEGCYCKTGFVLDSQGNCIAAANCGCLTPDGTSVINVGQQVTSLDCTVVYSCSVAGKIATMTSINPCGQNAVCTIVNNQPVCTCKPGFFGVNGVNCGTG
jgi:hypothetical protein